MLFPPAIIPGHDTATDALSLPAFETCTLDPKLGTVALRVITFPSSLLTAPGVLTAVFLASSTTKVELLIALLFPPLT